MDLLHLQYFVCVANSDTMQKAADTLNVSASTLSLAVKGLEEELGIPLFDRSGRKLKLTNAGQIFCDDASALLTQAQNLLQKMQHYRETQANTVYIASEAPDFTTEAGLLLRRMQPDLCLEQSDAARNEIRMLLQSGQVDFAVTLHDDSDKDIESVLLIREPMLLLVDLEHPLAQTEEIPFSRLIDETLINLNEEYAFRLMCELMFSIAGMRPKALFTLRGSEMIPRAVRNRQGVQLMPQSAYLMTKDEISHYVHAVRITDDYCVRMVYLTKLRGRSLSPTAQRCYDFVRAFGAHTAANGSFPSVRDLPELTGA